MMQYSKTKDKNQVDEMVNILSKFLDRDERFPLF